jgi:dTDP-4-amino-4,6-dideoxygalactose transaminase
MTELQGALGVVQIGKLERFTQKRINNAAFLTEHLTGIVQTPVTRPGCRHVYHQYTIRVPGHRDEWADRLLARGIGTAIHYPCPIHLQPFYREALEKFRIVSAVHKTMEGYSMKERLLPVAEEAAKQVLSLPVHPALSVEDLSSIAKEVRTLCD